MLLSTAEALDEMLAVYVKECERSSNYLPNMVKLRELLSDVTNEQRMIVLLGGCGMSALHWAAYRNHPEMITTILSSLNSSEKFNILTAEVYRHRTPLHVAAQWGSAESVDAILNSLKSKQQLQLLKVQKDGETAIEMASGQVFGRLLKYGLKASGAIRNGECY